MGGIVPFLPIDKISAAAGAAACPALPTALSCSLPDAVQFAHGHHDHKPEVPLHAMRDDGRPLRLRKILLPLPIADGSPPVRGWPLLLQALPRSLRLYRFGVGIEF